MGRQQQRRRQQRRQRERQTRKTSQRQQKGGWSGWFALAGAVIVVVAAALIYAFSHNSNGSSAASATATAGVTQASLAPAVDGIKCQAMEALAYHIHQYLELYDNGKRVQVPSAIGMPGGELHALCFYWIHAHAAYPDVIHVESPVHKLFTLGNFFDIWRATKADANPPGDGFVTRLQAAAARGNVTVYVDGKRWTGSYRSVVLKEHEVIAVEIGHPIVPPKPFTSWNGL